SEPQPLPNLDYKIMQGNSLLSRYALDMPLEDVFKEYNKGKSEPERMSLAKYKQLVADYTNTSDHTQKAGFRKTIENIKSAFRTELSRGEKEKFAKLKGQIIDLEAPMLFGERTKKEQEDLKKLKIKFAKQEQEQADIVNNKLYEDAFEWRFEFPQLLDDDGNFVGFDIVIGNPPYIFARENFSKEEKAYYSNSYKTAKYQLNTYMLFIERSIFLSVEKGISALIVPNSWLMIYSAEHLRSYLLHNCSLKSIVNITGKAFKEANVETIVMISKKEIEHKNTINLLTNSDDMKEFVFLHSREQESFCNNKGYELNLFSNDESSVIIEKIKNQSDILDELCSVKAGLQAYEKDKGTPAQTKEDVKNRPYDFRHQHNEDTYKYLEGADVKRYNITWGGSWLWYGKHLAAPRSFDLFSGERIIVREITGNFPNSIISTYTEQTYLYNRSNIAIIKRIGFEHISLKYIVAILNSTLMAFYFIKNTAKAERKLFPKIILNDLRLFPIKNITSGEQQPFIALVDKILEAKRLDPTTTLEAKIDLMVYKLYGLTYDEVLTIDPATPITQQQYEQ
ncbi:MAG: TaqI-like C-terminal specificity domain-containing protein, partial [Anaerovoracaceae bacterium]